uniref:Zgc:162331 n=1 Tax=Gadus morhua TaxID=8049 RepID=A0A8C5FNK5_GADMO
MSCGCLVTTDARTQARPLGDIVIVSPPFSPSPGLSCPALLPPRRGSFYVEAGTGVSVGSVLAFWCRGGYQLVGGDRVRCEVRRGRAEWSNHKPVCEAIPRPEDRGLRVAVLASVVSGVVILAMSVSFLICCLQERHGGQGGAPLAPQTNTAPCVQQAEGEAGGVAAGGVLAGAGGGGVGLLRTPQDLPPVPAGGPPAGPGQRPLPDRGPHGLREQRLPQVLQAEYPHNRMRRWFHCFVLSFMYSCVHMLWFFIGN